MKTVFVVTGLDLGWDCVVAVYSADSVSIEDLAAEYEYPDYVITERTIQTTYTPEESE